MNDMSEPAIEAPLLRLKALDAEDLAVLSAHLQNSVVRIADMAYLPKPRRFALVVSRFDWPLARSGVFQRCATGLHFESVTKVKRTGFDQDAERVLELVAMVFRQGPAPSGAVILSFAGGGAIQLEVECLEAVLSDLGSRWSVERKPGGAEDLP